MSSTPILIESGAKYYIYDALQMCHNNRVKIYSYALNIGILVIFVSIVSLALYFSYKNKPTPEETQRKMVKDQEMILSKIRFYQAEQKNLMSSLAKPGLRDLVGTN
jgi:hypothetical protein